MASVITRAARVLTHSRFAVRSVGRPSLPSGQAWLVDLVHEREAIGEALLDAEVDPQVLARLSDGWYVMREWDSIDEMVCEGPTGYGASVQRLNSIGQEAARWEAAPCPECHMPTSGGHKMDCSYPHRLRRGRG